MHSGFCHALTPDMLADQNRQLKKKNDFLKSAKVFMKQLSPLKYFLFHNKENYFNGTRTHNHLVGKRTPNHLAKLAS